MLITFLTKPIKKNKSFYRFSIYQISIHQPIPLLCGFPLGPLWLFPNLYGCLLLHSHCLSSTLLTIEPARLPDVWGIGYL